MSIDIGNFEPCPFCGKGTVCKKKISQIFDLLPQFHLDELNEALITGMITRPGPSQKIVGGSTNPLGWTYVKLKDITENIAKVNPKNELDLLFGSDKRAKESVSYQCLRDYICECIPTG